MSDLFRKKSFTQVINTKVSFTHLFFMKDQSKDSKEPVTMELNLNDKNGTIKDRKRRILLDQ